MAHIVILGAGVSGLPMAYELAELARASDSVTVVSETSGFRCDPAHPWRAADAAAANELEFALAPRLQSKGVALAAAGARRLHPERNQIELGDGSLLDYDFLVITTGPKLAFEDIEGLGPSGYTQSLCHASHGRTTRAAWERFLADPGPVIVGAVQGAACIGPAYEFAFLIDTDLRRRELRDAVELTFVTPEPFVGELGLGGIEDSASILQSALRERGIRAVVCAEVARVEAGRMHVRGKAPGEESAGAHVLPFKYAMMLPASRSIEAASGIDGLTDARGFVIVDEYQRNPRFRNIYAAGVSVAPPSTSPAPAATKKIPCMIESMVSAVASNIRDQLDGKEPSYRASWSAVALADLGEAGLAFVALQRDPASDASWVHLPRCSACDIAV